MSNQTENEPTTDRVRSTRRTWLTRSAVGGVAVVGGAVAGGAVAAARGPDVSVRRIDAVFDVACLGDTFREQLSDAQAAGIDVDPGDFRGSTFSVEGWIYPGEHITTSGFIPAEEDSIGRWFCSGFNIFGPERLEPHANATANFVLGTISDEHPFPEDTLVTTGLGSAPNVPLEPSHLPVLGGSGRYLGAMGQASRITTGQNTSIFFGTERQSPNFRYTFDLLIVSD